MEKPLAIANEFIRLAYAAGKPPSQMKLQKLIFFAHGWNLALFGPPLVAEQFQAWRYGPVLPSVYHEFKNYGVLGIDQEGSEFVSNKDGIGWETPKVEDPSGTTRALLQKVWDVFGQYTGTQLSEMTHASGSPWSQVREGRLENERNIPISNELISEYFTSLLTSS